MASQLSAATPGMLLAALRREGGLTRQDLLASTGMARSTLYGRLDQLQSAGLIYESGTRAPTGGRPATVVAFDDRDRVVLTIDIGHHRATVSLCELNGQALTEEVVPRTPNEAIPALVERLGGLGERALERAGGVRLLGVGLAIPAPVNTHTGKRLVSIALPDSDYPLVERLQERFGVHVAVENDARALTLGAAQEVPPMDDDGVLLGVKFSTGLGIGLITGGHIMRGSTGAAGDLGHLQITPGEGPVCTCGRRGCLAAYVTGRALVRDLARPGIATVGDVTAAYDAGDAEVVGLVHAAARLLGTHLGGFVQVSNPQYVVFGGFLGGRDAIAREVAAAIQTQVSPRISDMAEYRIVSGDHVTASGLVALVLDQALAPEAVDALVAASASNGSSTI